MEAFIGDYQLRNARGQDNHWILKPVSDDSPMSPCDLGCVVASRFLDDFADESVPQ